MIQYVFVFKKIYPFGRKAIMLDHACHQKPTRNFLKDWENSDDIKHGEKITFTPKYQLQQL